MWRIRRYWRQYVIRLSCFGAIVVLTRAMTSPWQALTIIACAGILLALAWPAS